MEQEVKKALKSVCSLFLLKNKWSQEKNSELTAIYGR